MACLPSSPEWLVSLASSPVTLPLPCGLPHRRRLRPEAAALDALPGRLAAEECGDEEQPLDVHSLLKAYLSKHESKALEVAVRHGRADLTSRLSSGTGAPLQQVAAAGEATPAAAEPLGSPPPSHRRHHGSSSGGSPQPPSTLRRRQQQPEAERSGGSRLRFSPAKSMR